MLFFLDHYSFLLSIFNDFPRFQTWTSAKDFMKICHPLGDVTYYLGYMFVTSQKPTSKGLVAEEEVPIDHGSMSLPARYPGDLTWAEEVRLLFPVFKRVNYRTYIGTGADRVVVPYVTLMQASKHNPFLFMSLVLQRAYDRLMRWPTREDAINPDYRANWKVCNMVKFPPIRQAYPISESELSQLRHRVSSHYVPVANGAMLDYLPDVLSPTERDNLLACEQIDAQYHADVSSLRRHLL